MDRFGYVRADTIEHGIRLLNEQGIRSRVLAGGTDLMLLLRERQDLCDRVVDITHIADLHCIQKQGSDVAIGAAATHCEVMESALVKSTAPVLAQACRQIGATQIRNMGTLGGNVANAAACADSLPALVCLDAIAAVATTHGVQEMPVSELVTGPNHTRIPSGGLLLSLRYRIPSEGSRSTFIKLGRRNAMAISRLTVAALIRLNGEGKIAEARLVPGSATPHIERFSVVEKALLGQLPSETLFAEAGHLAVSEMARISGRRWSSEYKEPALQSLVTRALMDASGLKWGPGWESV